MLESKFGKGRHQFLSQNISSISQVPIQNLNYESLSCVAKANGSIETMNALPPTNNNITSLAKTYPLMIDHDVAPQKTYGNERDFEISCYVPNYWKHRFDEDCGFNQICDYGRQCKNLVHEDTPIPQSSCLRQSSTQDQCTHREGKKIIENYGSNYKNYKNVCKKHSKEWHHDHETKGRRSQHKILGKQLSFKCKHKCTPKASKKNFKRLQSIMDHFMVSHKHAQDSSIGVVCCQKMKKNMKRPQNLSVFRNCHHVKKLLKYALQHEDNPRLAILASFMYLVLGCDDVDNEDTYVQDSYIHSNPINGEVDVELAQSSDCDDKIKSIQCKEEHNGLQCKVIPHTNIACGKEILVDCSSSTGNINMHIDIHNHCTNMSGVRTRDKRSQNIEDLSLKKLPPLRILERNQNDNLEFRSPNYLSKFISEPPTSRHPYKKELDSTLESGLIMNLLEITSTASENTCSKEEILAIHPNNKDKEFDSCKEGSMNLSKICSVSREFERSSIPYSLTNVNGGLGHSIDEDIHDTTNINSRPSTAKDIHLEFQNEDWKGILNATNLPSSIRKLQKEYPFQLHHEALPISKPTSEPDPISMSKKTTVEKITPSITTFSPQPPQLSSKTCIPPPPPPSP